MIKHLRLIYLLLFLYSFAILPVKAQNSFGSEDELKKQAQKLFDEEAFEEAYPLYTQLTSLYSKDPVYNYRLGVCMIYASDDKEKPIPFLEFASKNVDTEKEVFFYLAKAYHLNYRFDDAITMFVKYKSVAKPAKLKSLQVDRQIDMCKNGRKLLKNVTDLVVLEKKEVSKAEYFRSYDISSIGGKLLVKPDDPSFKSAIDKKKKEQSIIYLSADNSQVYFSSYGVSDENGKDIFVSRKMPTGEWSKPQTLGYPINTSFDEDYPFLHPNGKVLYFCSKGHNSMGGYDVFKSTFDEKSNTWSAPVNVDFPINTPDDDILYVTDKEEKEAYFSSARGSITGKTSVYHIDVKRKPVDASIVTGNVKKGKEGHPLAMKITVKNISDNVILGIYNSNASTGEYKMNLPNGGKFMFTVEAAGLPTQSEIVALPVQYELKPLSQEISFDQENKLKIKNLFDAAPSESSYLYALNYIKEKSRMDVTAANEINKANDLAKKIAQSKADSIANYKAPIAAEVKVDNSAKNNQLIQAAVGKANEDAKQARQLKEQAVLVNDIANQKTKLADIREKEGKAEEALELNKEALVAANIAEKIEVNAIAKQKEADLSKMYADNLEKEVNAGDPDKAVLNLSSQKKELDALSEKNKELENVELTYKNKLERKQKDLANVKQASINIKQEISDNETLIKAYEADIEKTKKKDVKEGLENQIAALKQDNIDSKKELQANDLKIIETEKEYASVKNENDIIASTVDKSKSSAALSSIAKTSENKTAANTTSSANSTSVKNANSSINKTPIVASTNSSANNANATKTNAEDTKPVETPVMLKAVESKYASELTKTDAIADIAEKEKKRAEVLDKWAKAIDAEVVAKKKEFITSTNEEKKTKLTDEILVSEKIAKAKHDEAVASDKKAKSLSNSSGNIASKSQLTQATSSTATSITNDATKNNTTKNEVATNNNALENVQEASVYNAKYAEDLKSVEKTENQIDKETKKYEVYASWINSINNEINSKEKEMQASTDAEKRTTLRNEITKLQNELSDKESISEALASNIESLKEQQALTAKKNPNLPGSNKTGSSASTVDTAKTATTVVQAKNASQNNLNAVDTAKSEKLVNNAKATSTQAKNASQNNLNAIDMAKSEKPANTTKSDVLLAKEEKSAPINNTAVANNSTSAKANTIVDTASTKNTTTTTQTLNNVNNNSLALSSNNSSVNVKEKKEKAVATYKEANNLVNQSNELKTKAATLTNANEKNATFEAAEKLTKQAETKQIEAAAMDAEANSAAFSQNFYTIESIAKINSAPDADDVAMAELMVDDSKVYFEKAQKLREDAKKEPVFYTKNALLIEAKENEELAIKKQEQAFTIYKGHNPNFAVPTTTLVATNAAFSSTVQNKVTENTSATSSSNPSNSGSDKNKISENASVTAVDKNKTDESAIVSTNTKSTTTPSSASNAVNTAKSNAINSGLAPGEKFELKSAIIYSDAKPIPINEKLPEGLIFKVQIGAFRNAIPQDLFQGISPITGELTANGLTRYTAGFFKKFGSANKAKGDVQGFGYPDAFVVAFFNGNRISMGEALAMTNEKLPVANNINVPATNSLNSTASINNSENKSTTAVVSSNTSFAKTEKLEQVAGLFYTIQVGVYSQPVSTDKLFNIQPLYSETISTGNMRYTSGMYNNMPRAVEAKNILVNIGVRDAFVAAYNKGKRITMGEAIQLEGQGSNVLATSTIINKLPMQNGNTITASSPISVNTSQPTPAGNVNVTFKVQLGAYREEVPLDMVNKFLGISNKGIQNYKDASGVTVYTLGNFKNYEEAAKLKNEVVAASIPGAFVVAYNNGNKIAVEEAMRLIK